MHVKMRRGYGPRASEREQEAYARAARVPESISDQVNWCPRCANTGMDPYTGERCPCFDGQEALWDEADLIEDIADGLVDQVRDEGGTE